jgi:hypothetical protein
MTVQPRETLVRLTGNDERMRMDVTNIRVHAAHVTGAIATNQFLTIHNVTLYLVGLSQNLMFIS